MSKPSQRSEELDRLVAHARAELRNWADSSAKDPGVAIVELLAYVGDLIAAHQDIIANEAYLGTARRRPARLRVEVDADWTEASSAEVCGIYRAKVIDNVDPMMQRRLRVVIPDVTGDRGVWAVACLPASRADTVPSVGDAIWVAFESGDPDQPVWLGRLFT